MSNKSDQKTKKQSLTIPEKGKAGKPSKHAGQEDKIHDLAQVGCTDNEIMRLTGIKSTETLYYHYREQLINGRAHIRESLRRKMIEKALDGDVTMLKWLSKNYLGMKEDPDTAIQVVNSDGDTTVNIAKKTDDELIELAQQQDEDQDV